MVEEYQDMETLNMENLIGPESPVERVPLTSPNISDEMREYSRNRTGKHIDRVVTFGKKLGFDFEQHDHTKFSEELIDHYVLIDNSYRKDLNPPVEYSEALADASFKHIKREPHHPEYWDDDVVMNRNVDRDSPDVVSMVDASDMSVPAIAEMVCDWCAMSVELGGNPADWAVKNIGTRWSFTEPQETLIFMFIEMLWDPEEIFDVDDEEPIPTEYRVDKLPDGGNRWTLVSTRNFQITPKEPDSYA